MNTIDPLQSSLFFTAAREAAKTQARESQKEEIKKKNITARRFSQDLDTQIKQTALQGLPPEIAQMTTDEAVVFLKDQVDIAGDILKSQPYAESFPAFKKAVSNFLKYVVEQSYEVENHQSRRTIKRQKKYTLVNVINEQLDKLASDVVFNHLDKIRLTAKVEEITGILIDLIT